MISNIFECYHNRFQPYLKVLAQFVHHSLIFTSNFLAPGAAVGGVVANMDACSREGGALSARTCGALRGAFTLNAIIRFQKIPLPYKVYAAVGLAGAFLLSGD